MRLAETSLSTSQWSKKKVSKRVWEYYIVPKVMHGTRIWEQ